MGQCQRFGRNWKTYLWLLQVIMIIVALDTRFSGACATAPVELVPNDSSGNGDPKHLDYGLKRNWQSLQGPWGKRAMPDQDIYIDDHVPTNDDVFMPDSMMEDNAEPTDPKFKYTMFYLTNAATLNRLANQRISNEIPGEYGNDMMMDNAAATTEDMNDIYTDKRTWKNMNVAWGKRRNNNNNNWNKFRGNWGKREPGWNNLKGMWGKRSQDWQQLHHGWGKRNANQN